MDTAHMDIASRNERLYEHLKAMGLFVVPIFADGDQNQIDHFHVSAGLPAYLPGQQIPQQTASGTVSHPMASAEIVKLVRPTES